MKNVNYHVTFADDLATLINTLNTKNAMLAGLLTGGGEVARDLGEYDSAGVSKAVLLLIHEDDDQIVPMAVSATAAMKLLKNARPGA